MKADENLLSYYNRAPGWRWKEKQSWEGKEAISFKLWALKKAHPMPVLRDNTAADDFVFYSLWEEGIFLPPSITWKGCMPSTDMQIDKIWNANGLAVFAVGWTVFCWKAGWQDTVLQSLNHCTESQPCWQDPILRKFTVLSNTCCCHWMILCKIWNSIYRDPYLIFFFFPHPLQAPESQMTALKPFPKSVIQYSAWCQDNSSCRVKFCSSDSALMQKWQNSEGYRGM